MRPWLWYSPSLPWRSSCSQRGRCGRTCTRPAHLARVDQGLQGARLKLFRNQQWWGGGCCVGRQSRLRWSFARFPAAFFLEPVLPIFLRRLSLCTTWLSHLLVGFQVTHYIRCQHRWWVRLEAVKGNPANNKSRGGDVKPLKSGADVEPLENHPDMKSALFCFYTFHRWSRRCWEKGSALFVRHSPVSLAD